MSRHLVLCLSLALLGATPAAAQPKSVLFYGNSFTMGLGSTRSVNALFREIAIAAGQETPLVQSAAASGQTLGWHLDNNTQAIFTLIPPDQNWDAVVLQEHSTKLTRAYTGSPRFPESIVDSQSDAAGLYQRVATRSPDVVPVLYETWARGPGHAFYTGSTPLYTGPAEMQAEVRAGYDLLQEAVNASAGAEIAKIAPVGDAWEEAAYDRLHSGDRWHAQNRGTLLAALVIYGTVYDDPTTSDIDLSSVLSSISLSQADGEFLTAAADRTLAPIPEPTACFLATLGAAALALRSRG